MTIIHPDGRLVKEWWSEARERGYCIWAYNPANVLRGFTIDGAIHGLEAEYGGVENVPQDKAIVTILDVLDAGLRKDSSKLFRYVEFREARDLLMNGYVVDMVLCENIYVMPTLGPKTVEFLQRVIEYWEPIDERIAEKARGVLALYVSQRL